MMHKAVNNVVRVEWTHRFSPLTPTLSLGEREERSPFHDQSNASSRQKHGRGCPLSLRERVGVRGKEPLEAPHRTNVTFGRHEMGKLNWLVWSQPNLSAGKAGRCATGAIW